MCNARNARQWRLATFAAAIRADVGWLLNGNTSAKCQNAFPYPLLYVAHRDLLVLRLMPRTMRAAIVCQAVHVEFGDVCAALLTPLWNYHRRLLISRNSRKSVAFASSRPLRCMRMIPMSARPRWLRMAPQVASTSMPALSYAGMPLDIILIRRNRRVQFLRKQPRLLVGYENGALHFRHALELLHWTEPTCKYKPHRAVIPY